MSTFWLTLGILVILIERFWMHSYQVPSALGLVGGHHMLMDVLWLTLSLQDLPRVKVECTYLA